MLFITNLLFTLPTFTLDQAFFLIPLFTLPNLNFLHQEKEILINWAKIPRAKDSPLHYLFAPLIIFLILHLEVFIIPLLFILFYLQYSFHSVTLVNSLILFITPTFNFTIFSSVNKKSYGAIIIFSFNFKKIT